MQIKFLSTIKTAFFVIFLTICSFFTSSVAYAHQPNLVFLNPGDVEILNPEISQAFYDELTGTPRNYYITSDRDFVLYINILVPEIANRNGRYSANVFSIKNDGTEEKIATIDGTTPNWSEYYESYGRDYYLKGPELESQLLAGKYKIEIFSADQTAEAVNLGKYVLAVGKTESYDLKTLLNIYWQIPTLKIKFFQSDVWQFFLTPFGIAGIGFIGAILIFITLLNYIISVIKKIIKQNQAKTILLTSTGMQMKNEIVKLLQKPAYDITVAFIITAAKPQQNLDYVKKDYDIMREMGFNVAEVDIEGKTEKEVTELIRLKDIIYVEGGNTFYLLQAMRKCNFEKIMRKLLKEGKVYLGVSAGSVVAGKTIKSAGWLGDENIVNLKSLKGLNLVPFDIFVHYKPEHAELIKKKLPWKWQRKKMKIITDEQAILVQAKNVILLGNQDEVII